jgi:8-amino-7-oxononanoate synthase
LGLVAAADPARAHLAALVARFRIGAAVAGLPLLPGAVGPIQPILLGGEARALAVSQDLRARGLHVPAIRPPTVAVGTARLRISFSAAHSPAQVDALIKALAEALAAHPA